MREKSKNYRIFLSIIIGIQLLWFLKIYILPGDYFIRNDLISLCLAVLVKFIIFVVPVILYIRLVEKQKIAAYLKLNTNI